MRYEKDAWRLGVWMLGFFCEKEEAARDGENGEADGGGCGREERAADGVQQAKGGEREEDEAGEREAAAAAQGAGDAAQRRDERRERGKGGNLQHRRMSDGCCFV